MGLDHVNYLSKDTAKTLLETRGFKVKRIKSSIEIKLFLMYSFYDRKRNKEAIKQTATQAERQEYFNKTTKRPKWQLRLIVLGHNFLYRLLSFLEIGDEMIVIAQKA